MIAQRNASSDAWDKENVTIIDTHERHVARIKKAHEDFLADQQVCA